MHSLFIPGRSLSVEEAVELLFRLPDDPRESDIESELADSENEVVPALAPVEESDSGDNALDQPSTSTGKRRRSSYVRKKPKKRKRRPRSPEPVQSDNSDSRDVASEGTALWSTALPVLNNRSVSSLEPQYSSKLSSSCTPSESFSLYFNDDVLEMIVLETNRYARQEARRGWHDLTKGELKAYLGILILMSVNPAHHLYLYWSSDSFFNVKEISSVMTFKRFQAIMNSLHFYDNEKIKSKGEEGFDRLAKIRPLVDTLNKKFLQEYKPSGHQAIDESMVRFKGRSALKQYAPMKPIKRGYKVWCRADSVTGYLCEFQIYEGKSAEREAGRTLGEHVVLSLCNNVDEDSTLYFDNFFTTTKLMEELSEKQIMAAGTVRTNRKDLPHEIKVDQKLKRGDYVWRSKGQLTAYQWRDNRNVTMLSNFHDPSEVVEVNRTLSNGATVGVTCPKVVSDYNKFMGGVDRFDQKRNAYMCDRRSKKGWYRLFYYLLDAAVVNAFIQHCHFTPNEYLWFRLALGRELISGQSFRKKTAIPAFQHKKRGRQSGQKMVGVPGEIRFHKGDHHPVKTTGRKRCRWCSTKAKEIRTALVCKVCNVPLCATCFLPFHNGK